MRYSDLGKIEIHDIWRFDPNQSTPDGKGRSYGEIWREKQIFIRMKGEIKDNIIQSITRPLEAAETEKDIGVILDPIFERYSKSYFCHESVDKDLLVKKANKNTLQKKLQSWCAQLNQNVKIVKEKPGVSIFFNKLKNVPAVIVCAGPSLRQAIDKLKPLKGKAMIMAVDTSLKPCVKRGLDPDFVNAHDANAAGARFFEGIDTEAVGLFVNYVNPRTIQAYRGPLCFYYVADDSIPTYGTMALACDGPNRKDGSFLKSKIIGGSSVAHTALYTAIAMGCDPITFVGLDLSYPDLKDSHFESANPKSLDNQKLIDTINIQGKTVKTNLSFYSYKTVFDRMAPAMIMGHGVQLFTSTEDKEGKITGIVYEGLRPLPFQEFIDRYCQDEHEELKQIREIYDGAT